VATDKGELNQYNARVLNQIHSRRQGIATGEIEPAKA